MVTAKWSGAGLLTSTLWLAVISPTFAQEQVTVTPESLVVAGVRGTTETRTLLIQTPQPVNRITVTPLDLNRTDGIAVLPASRIQVSEPVGKNQVAVDKTLSLPLRFTLDRAGEYSGSLLLSYEGGQRVVPITARVKDAPWLPLFLLLGGVGLGIWLSNYRSAGKLYDESVVRVGQLRTQVRSDGELAAPFATVIEGYLVDVETALGNRQFEAAQQAIAQAQGIWNKWRKGREDWLAQLSYQKTLTEMLTKIDPDTPYEQEVRAKLEDSVREAASLESPSQLRQRLQTLQQQINRYLQGTALLEELSALREKLPATDREEFWRQEGQRLRRQLNELSPASTESFETWKQTVETARKQLREELEQTTSRGPAAPDFSTRESQNQNVQYLKPVPSAKPFSNPTEIQSSARRLRTANTLSYTVIATLLAMAGFTQLYLKNPTFGATVGDYFTLLAWGFGAEATSESIAKVMQRWGLPGGQ